MKRSDLYRAVARDIAAKAKNDRLIDDDEENSVNDNIVNYDSIGNLGTVDIFDDIIFVCITVFYVVLLHSFR